MTKAEKVARALGSVRWLLFDTAPTGPVVKAFQQALAAQGLAIVEREPSQAEIDEATRELVKRTKTGESQLELTPAGMAYVETVLLGQLEDRMEIFMAGWNAAKNEEN